MIGVKPSAGDLVRVLCTTTNGQQVTTVVKVISVIRLGCGCYRAEAERPGPQQRGVWQFMELIFQRCARIHGEGPEPELVTEPSADLAAVVAETETSTKGN